MLCSRVTWRIVMRPFGLWLARVHSQVGLPRPRHGNPDEVVEPVNRLRRMEDAKELIDSRSSSTALDLTLWTEKST